MTAHRIDLQDPEKGHGKTRANRQCSFAASSARKPRDGRRVHVGSPGPEHKFRLAGDVKGVVPIKVVGRYARSAVRL
jgi:hypothetical protein